MIAAKRNLSGLPRAEPRIPPFKVGSHLTCRHGRFWSSCKQCRLRGETVQRTVAISGDSPQRLDQEAPHGKI